MKCQRGKLFDRREFFSEQWNEAEFIAKDLKPKFFWHFSSKKSANKIIYKHGVLNENIRGILDTALTKCRILR
jgi:hypothetical protein